MTIHDVVVIGGGNAALCAALSAAEHGADVLVLERAPEERRGGNSAFTGGAFRVAYDGIDDIRKLVPDLSQDEADSADFGSYTETQFLDEWMASSQYRCDGDLVERVVRGSLDTLLWLRTQGARFVPLFGRQAFKVDGKFRFWGGLTVEVSGGGLGLMETLYRKCEQRGIAVRYGTRAAGLARQPDGSWRVRVEKDGAPHDFTEIAARTVVIASGGFHANLEWRAKYLGPNWDLAKVRGSRYNTGDGIRMALDAGAVPHGHWSGCHAVFYDLNAPPLGDIHQLNQQKNYFSHGIVVNAEGQRFFDEGADFRNYIYSKMGAKVLAQPQGVAWQVFDARTNALLPGEYRTRGTTRLQADTLEALAAQMEGIDAAAFLRTVGEFNAAADGDTPFNPAVKDGRCTRGLAIEKTNWAVPLAQAPFVAYAVTCGITFTLGGLKVDTDGQVLDLEDRPLGGLYAAGELVGGLYYVNYAGGAGLTAGSAIGRAAGRHAALRVKG